MLAIFLYQTNWPYVGNGFTPPSERASLCYVTQDEKHESSAKKGKRNLKAANIMQIYQTSFTSPNLGFQIVVLAIDFYAFQREE